MNNPTHFHNFAPADAVQWTGTDDGFDIVAEHLADQGFDLAQSGDMLAIWTADRLTELHRLRPGQWLVRPVGDTRVWVQDDEPARVERWEWSWGWATDDAPNWLAVVVEGVSDARPYISAEKIAPVTRYRRPILNNDWRGGPWSPVEGGAE